MESLALLVCLIFVIVAGAGPMALLLNKLGFVFLAIIVALFSILLGGWWLLVTPFPVSLIGGFAAICGAVVVSRY